MPPPRFAATLLLLLFALFGCAHDPATRVSVPAPFAHEHSDLKPDPAVVWGRLENGLRYAILPHPTPRDRVSVYLLVQAGSFHERNDEQGFAHYVEHMAFRDTAAFPGDSGNQALQRLGVSSEAHANATTGLFETDYWFNNLPSDDPEALPLALKLARSVADGLAFVPAAVEQERGVIFSEARSRQGSLVRARDDELEFMTPRELMPNVPELGALFGSTRIAERNPIGTEETLQAATAARLRRFYARWYRPERIVLVVAGDLSPAAVEPLVREAFAGLSVRGRAPAAPAIPPPAALRPDNLPIFFTALEHEPAMHLTLAAGRVTAASDSLARRRQALARKLALAMLGRRLELESEKPDAPFVSSEALINHYVPGRELIFFRATASPTAWEKALTRVNLEVRRSRELGFTPAEFEQARREELMRLRSNARQARTRSSSQLAGVLAYAIARDVVFTSLEDDRTTGEALLGDLTAAECHAAFKELLPAGNLAIGAAGPLRDEGEGKAALAAITASLEAPLEPYPEPPPRKPFPYTDYGPPGRIARREYSAALGAELVQFENGVRLNLKATDFEPGYAHVLVRFGAGRLLTPPSQPGLGFTTFAWIFGGLKDFTNDELHASLTEIAGSASLSVNVEDVRLGIDGETAALPLMLQTNAAFFVHPAFRIDDWPRALEVARQQVAEYESTADGVARATLLHRLTGRHPGHNVPRVAEIGQRTPDELKAWLSPQLSSAPLEITLVGDFKAEEAIAIVARTFGALPPRENDAIYAAQRRLSFPPAPFTEEVTFEGKQSVAVVSLAWPVPEAISPAERLRGKILASILADRIRLKLRNELGETYTPVAEFTWSDVFTPAFTYLDCRVEAAPERATRVATVVRELVATLAREGVSAEEFERARRPLTRDFENHLRDNGWWLETLADAQSVPAHAATWMRAQDEYRAATRDEIDALARRLFSAERQCQLIVTPKPAK